MRSNFSFVLPHLVALQQQDPLQVSKQSENRRGTFRPIFGHILAIPVSTDTSSTCAELVALLVFTPSWAISSSTDEYIRLHSSKGVLHSATTGIRRRDSKNLAPPDDDSQERRSSADQGYSRRPSLVDHVRQSSAGDSGRRGSADSDGDGFDEVVAAGAPWEPAFSRTPIDPTPLEWAMVRALFHDPASTLVPLAFAGCHMPHRPRPASFYCLFYPYRLLIEHNSDTQALNWTIIFFRPTQNSVQVREQPRRGFGMTVEIPKNMLNVNTLQRGGLGVPGMEPATPDTPGSASSAMKTPTLSPMAFGQKVVDPRFPMLSEGNGHSNTVVMVPLHPSHEEPPFLRSMSSNGSSHSELPSFHQQPFPNGPFTPVTPITSPHSPTHFRPALPNSVDIERELQNGLDSDGSYSSDSDVEVMEPEVRGGGSHYNFPNQQLSPLPSPSLRHQPSQPKVAPPSNNSSPRVSDLRSGMKTGGSGSGRRAASVSSGSSSARPVNLAFKRGNLIGRGGFGSVYQGLLSTGQLIAVKVLELPPDVDPSKSSTYVSFLKEIDMLKALKHPNIVRYIGSTVEGSTINVLLEYVAGGSISSMVTRFGPFEEPEMQRLARHILRALAYLHENNIAHRDIKGANILVDDAGVAKLADFGCSKSVSVKSGIMGAENFQTMLGTPYWMAPEVMRSEGHGRLADIWSFGCTLIEMASGKPPWAKDYTQVRFRQDPGLARLYPPLTWSSIVAMIRKFLLRGQHAVFNFNTWTEPY